MESELLDFGFGVGDFGCSVLPLRVLCFGFWRVKLAFLMGIAFLPNSKCRR
jgi:hypothetical protein